MKLPYTRRMLHAALAGELDNVPAKPHPVFKVIVPDECPGLPPGTLDARGMWADKEAYDRAARDLAGRFNQNFRRFTDVEQVVRDAGPCA